MGIVCPKCGSSSLHSEKHGFSTKKAAIGMLTVGGLLPTLLAGNIGSGKVRVTCLSCGHSFKPGYGGVSSPESYHTPPYPEKILTGFEEHEARIARHESQRGIKKEIAHTTIYRKQAPTNKKVICTCGAPNEPHFKYCRVCGLQIDLTIMPMIKNGQNFEYMKCPHCSELTVKPSNKVKFCVRCGKEIIK